MIEGGKVPQELTLSRCSSQAHQERPTTYKLQYDFYGIIILKEASKGYEWFCNEGKRFQLGGYMK